MKLLQSKKFKLPTLYLVTDKNEIKDIGPGVPFIYGDKDYEEHLIRILEYEILYQKAIKTGLPFDFKQILKDSGYDDIKDFSYYIPEYIEYVTSNNIEENDFSINDDDKFDKSDIKGKTLFSQFIKDSAVHVDIQKIKDLKTFPIWLLDIEEAILTNIHNFSIFNPYMYNKKLDGMYGDIEMVSSKRNLFINDISGSIPKGASSTVLSLFKNMGEEFHADLLITGTKSVLYPYEILHELDINTIYEEIGMGNDQKWFKKLVTSDIKHYGTAIVFGDNHSPSNNWNGNGTISKDDGKKLCKWKIDKLISLHMSGTKHTAGYADWFTIEEKDIIRVSDWLKYLNK